MRRLAILLLLIGLAACGAPTTSEPSALELAVAGTPSGALLLACEPGDELNVEETTTGARVYCSKIATSTAEPTLPPTATPLPPTATTAPTVTPEPPTATNEPPTATSTAVPTLPPTATPLPPTATTAPTVTPEPPTATPALGGGFSETFDGAPSAPAAFDSPDFFRAIVSRNNDTWLAPDSMSAQHGPGCQPPPLPSDYLSGNLPANSTHIIDEYDEVFFRCADHMMSAISGDGYAAAYFGPAALMDWTDGEAVLRFDVSTFRTSGRDFWDIHVTPIDKTLLIPLLDWLPAQSGEPSEAIRLRLQIATAGQGSGLMKIGRCVNHSCSDLGNGANYESVLSVDTRDRETFEIRISSSTISASMPDYGLNIGSGSNPFTWSRGVVTFGHHSYNPYKATSMGPNTWHWDNIEIEPAVDFAIIQTAPRMTRPSDGFAIAFDSPAPAGSLLKCTGIGDDVDVSFGGAFVPFPLGDVESFAVQKWHDLQVEVPAGSIGATFSGGAWWGGEAAIANCSIWVTP